MSMVAWTIPGQCEETEERQPKEKQLLNSAVKYSLLQRNAYFIQRLFIVYITRCMFQTPT